MRQVGIASRVVELRGKMAPLASLSERLSGDPSVMAAVPKREEHVLTLEIKKRREALAQTVHAMMDK
eukprot:4408547-Pyramimonas_sp.AAC.1